MKRLAFIIKKYDKLKSNMVRAIYSIIAEEGSKGVFRLERKTEFAAFFAIILFQLEECDGKKKSKKVILATVARLTLILKPQIL